MISHPPYLLVSDLHFHNWGEFSTEVDGVNSRLQHIIDALNEAITTLILKGGDQVIIAGDVFHVRGSLVPSVLNPVLTFIREWCDKGITFHCIDGNHDLESKNAVHNKSATSALRFFCGSGDLLKSYR